MGRWEWVGTAWAGGNGWALLRQVGMGRHCMVRWEWVGTACIGKWEWVGTAWLGGNGWALQG